jgi:hypothetical protein
MMYLINNKKKSRFREILDKIPVFPDKNSTG